MGKEIYLHVKEPCHEKWEAMSPVEQGRFCQSCAKKVIDFSRMSDREVLEVLSKASGSTCGRFTGGQLERPMVKEKEIPFFLKPYKVALASMVPLFVISGEIYSQHNELQGKVAVQKEVAPAFVKLGEVAMTVPGGSLIRGRVLTEDGKALADATIRVKGTNTLATSNAAGSFSIQYQPEKTETMLLITALGYAPIVVPVKKNSKDSMEIRLTRDEIIFTGMVITGKRIAKTDKPDNYKIEPKQIAVKGRVVNAKDEPLPLATVVVSNNPIFVDKQGFFSFEANNGSQNINISATHAGYQKAVTKIDLQKEALNNVKLVLEEQPGMDTVVVTGYHTQTCYALAGGLSIVETVTPRDTLKTWVQKIFRNELFTAFPNPVTRGQTLHLRFKKEGDYSLQLFDNSGRLYIEKQIRLAGKEQDFLLAMPATIGSGVYYLKAINTTSKKLFTEKIVVP